MVHAAIPASTDGLCKPSGTPSVWCSPGATCVQPSKLWLLQSTDLLREIVELPRIPGNTAASKVFEVSSALDTRNVFYDRFNGWMHACIHWGFIEEQWMNDISREPGGIVSGKKLAGPDLRSSPTQAGTHKIYFLYPFWDHQPSLKTITNYSFHLTLWERAVQGDGG